MEESVAKAFSLSLTLFAGYLLLGYPRIGVFKPRTFALIVMLIMCCMTITFIGHSKTRGQRSKRGHQQYSARTGSLPFSSHASSPTSHRAGRRAEPGHLDFLPL